MHPNAELLQQLYSNLDSHHPDAMADCYHPDATFHDIAFDLQGKDQIRSMWEMICSGDIRATFEIVSADAYVGVVNLVDRYTFSETQKPVVNPIESRFKFKDGLIIEHRDSCDAKAWATQALGPIIGFLPGRIRFLRAWKAKALLRAFIKAKAQHG